MADPAEPLCALKLCRASCFCGFDPNTQQGPPGHFELLVNGQNMQLQVYPQQVASQKETLTNGGEAAALDDACGSPDARASAAVATQGLAELVDAPPPPPPPPPTSPGSTRPRRGREPREGAPAAPPPAGALTPKGRPAEIPPGRTILGVVADQCSKAQILDKSGVLVDVAMDPFLEAAESCRLALSVLTYAAVWALTDFERSLASARACYEEDPVARRTVRDLLLSEMMVQGMHCPGKGIACKLRDPSGAHGLQWLLRSLEFFITFLKLAFEGDASAGSRAYAQTLERYHGRPRAIAVKAAVAFMPDRAAICRTQALGPRLDEERLREFLVSDVHRATGAMLPTIARMIATHRELGLWESAT